MKRFFALVAVAVSMMVAGCSDAPNQIKTTPEQAAELYSTAGTAAMGAKDAPITMVELFDYGCRYCRKDYPMLVAFVKQHPQVRLIFKPFKAFGDNSMVLPQYAGLAAEQQGRFLAMHHALMTTHHQINRALVMRFAQETELNLNQFKQAMASNKVHDQIEANTALINGLGVQGIPTVVVTQTKLSQNPQLSAEIPQYIETGFLSSDNLLKLVKQVEKDSQKK